MKIIRENIFIVLYVLIEKNPCISGPDLHGLNRVIQGSTIIRFYEKKFYAAVAYIKAIYYTMDILNGNRVG